MPNLAGTIYLETNGTLPEKFELIKQHVDIISMDIKLPSSSKMEFWDKHRNFLRQAIGCDLFVKIVVSGQTDDDEYLKAIDLVAEVNRAILVVVQPVSPVDGVIGISPARVLHLQNSALKILQDVRVIPQTHKIMGQL